MVGIIGVVKESVTMSLVYSGVILVSSALCDVVRTSIVAYWVFGIETLVLPIINLCSWLDIRRIAVSESAVICAMEL